MKVCAIQGLPAQVLQLTRIAKLFEVYPDLNRARLAFREERA